MQIKACLDMLSEDLELTNSLSISCDDNNHIEPAPFRDKFRNLVKNSFFDE